MAEIIAQYSPNIRWGKQHVEITLALWDYATTHVVLIGGNTRGLSVLEYAPQLLYDKLAEECEPDLPKLILKSPAGKVLLSYDEDGLGEEWLKDMVVGLRIIDWTPPTVNEVRKLNGAKPLPDGDLPWSPE